MAYKLKDNEVRLELDVAGVSKSLKAIGTPVDEIKKANEVAGGLVLRTARNIAPVRSGALRKSIRIARVTTNVAIRAGMKRVPYANPIHWGWFYDKENFITKNIKPNPFMARALGYNRDEILDAYKEQVQKLINKYEPPASVKNRLW
jgi:hypothetical protein